MLIILTSVALKFLVLNNGSQSPNFYMNIEGNKSGGRLYQPMGQKPYGMRNALPPLVSGYAQINVDCKRKK